MPMTLHSPVRPEGRATERKADLSRRVVQHAHSVRTGATCVLALARRHDAPRLDLIEAPPLVVIIQVIPVIHAAIVDAGTMTDTSSAARTTRGWKARARFGGAVVLAVRA